MTTDVVQPAAEARIGLDVGSVAVTLRSEGRENFHMLEQLAFAGMSANPVESIPIHGALLRPALRGQQQK
jgi:hypothetical protein